MMPIKPENRARYPKDWPQIVARIRERARNKCENCGVRNGAWGFREDGVFHRVNKRAMIDAVKCGRERVRPPFNFGLHRIIVIVCTTAHLDHVPEHVDDDNLRFWCQKCHLAYDHKYHQANAYQTRREGKAVDMFEEQP